MDFEDLKKIGNRLGTAAIMVFDQKTCLVGATFNLMEFFATGVVRLVHAVPGRASLHAGAAVENRKRGRQRRIHTQFEMLCKEVWNSYCALRSGGRRAGNQPARFF